MTRRFIVLLVFFVSLARIQPGDAQGQTQFIDLLQQWEYSRTGLSQPAGLVFSPAGNNFLVLEVPNPGEAFPAQSEIRHLSVLGQGAGSTHLPFSIDNPLNLAFDDRSGRLWIYQADQGQLIAINIDANGHLAPHSLTTCPAGALGLRDPQGMTVASHQGTLIILDAAGPRLVLLTLPTTGCFTRAQVTRVDLHLPGSTGLRGIAFDPHSGSLHLLSPAEKMLYELTPAGALVARRDLSGFPLDNPQAIVFAPSGDQTDDPAALGLYLADSGVPAAITATGLPGSPIPGKVLEFSLTQPLPQFSAAVEDVFFSALVRTTDMAAFSPPSPDPSGLTFISTANTLLASDGEVEETAQGITHFQGANLWEMALDGSLLGAANISTVQPTVVPMSNEPTGVAWNPVNGHYFFSDDEALRVYELDPGLDGMVGTADDSWTSFSTAPAGNGDPEGIAYDSWYGQLFVIDGSNREVYQYTLGGELVAQFDVDQYGAMDPEGIEFNPLEGTLFVLSNRGNRVILELSTSGSLLQIINVSASAALAPAGLAFAPASDSSGARNFYIVDRGIDNNTDPDIIDGKMYEMTAPITFSKISPLNGADDQPLSLTLVWSAGATTSGYQYCFDTTDDNACSGWVNTGSSTSAEISNLSTGTTYFWHVRTVDTFGTTYANGAETAYWAFTTGSPPGDFNKLSPASGATNQPLNLSLSWEAANGAASYEYCYDTSNDAACSDWVDVGAATSTELSGLTLNTTLYWHVRAVNSFGVIYSDGASTAFAAFSTTSGIMIYLPFVLR